MKFQAYCDCRLSRTLAQCLPCQGALLVPPPSSSF